MTSDDQPASSDEPRTRLVRERYRKKIGHLARIEDVGIRRHAIRETLLELDPAVATFWIDQLIRGAIWGRQSDLDVMVGLGLWLAETPRGGAHYRWIEEVYRLAHDHQVDTVLFLLRNPPPHMSLDEEADLPDVRLPLDRDNITVGARRTLARKADRDMIDRLVLDPSPLVIENLLTNSDLTETDVLRIASRRPTTPDILNRIAQSHRWMTRMDVRKALVMNPYNETGRSLKILPTTGIAALRNVRFGSDLHPALGEAAEYLVDMRETHTSPWEV